MEKEVCMKKMWVILFALMITAAGASAQKVIIGGGFGHYHPYYYHPYYYRPYYGLNYGFAFGYPYYRPNYYYRHPSKLDRQITDIENDYADRISSVRMDNSLTGRERRHEIRDLRKERDEAVDNARRNYYKRADRNYNNQNNSNQNNNNDNNQQ